VGRAQVVRVVSTTTVLGPAVIHLPSRRTNGLCTTSVSSPRRAPASEPERGARAAPGEPRGLGLSPPGSSLRHRWRPPADAWQPPGSRPERVA
jgi:hypothetical protein